MTPTLPSPSLCCQGDESERDEKKKKQGKQEQKNIFNPAEKKSFDCLCIEVSKTQASLEKTHYVAYRLGNLV